MSVCVLFVQVIDMKELRRLKEDGRRQQQKTNSRGMEMLDDDWRFRWAETKGRTACRSKAEEKAGRWWRQCRNPREVKDASQDSVEMGGKKDSICREMKVEWRAEENVCVIKTQYAQIPPRYIKISSFKLKFDAPLNQNNVQICSL